MPASSLWLVVPQEDHEFNKCLKTLISDTVPSNFSSSIKKDTNFVPHVTLTSDIDPAGTYEKSSPQQWLDNLSLPEGLKKEHNEATVELDAVEAGEPYFRKITLRASKKDSNFLKLAAKCREQGLSISETEAQTWAEKEYLPHLSLLYADMSKEDAQKRVPMVETQLGWEFGSLFDCCGGTLCMGAKLVLVNTSKTVDEWVVIAERDVPWVRWTMARSLI